MSLFEAQSSPLPCGQCRNLCELGKRLVLLVNQKRTVLSIGSDLLSVTKKDFDDMLQGVPSELIEGVNVGASKAAIAKDMDILDSEIITVKGDIDERNLACKSILEAWADSQGGF
jgi:hypothetical protein